MNPVTELDSLCGDYLRTIDSAVLFVTMDRSGTIIDSNRTADTIFGKPLNGMAFRDFIVDFHSTVSLEHLVTAHESRHLLSVNTASDIPQSLYFSFYEHGEFITGFGSPDIREQETFRKQILDVTNQMSNLARELHKQKIELERLNALKNRFIGMAAHDLRKPVGLVLSYNEFLLEDIGNDIDPEHRSFLEIIEKASFNMKRIIDDFLELSIIESGSLKLEYSNSDIVSLFREVIEEHDIEFKRRSVNVAFGSSDTEIMAVLDGPKLKQVAGNLLSNAIEHAPVGSTVRVRIDSRIDYVETAVWNTGDVIPPETMNNLFEPYVRSGKSSSGSHHAGLGLAIARLVVKEHGGIIWAESDEECGTVFRFRIPVRPGGEYDI